MTSSCKENKPANSVVLPVESSTSVRCLPHFVVPSYLRVKLSASKIKVAVVKVN